MLPPKKLLVISQMQFVILSVLGKMIIMRDSGTLKAGLKSAGYEMYYTKNSWSDAEYKGINTRWVTPEGQRFEVQFHTPESFHAKHEVTHKAYEHLQGSEDHSR